MKHHRAFPSYILLSLAVLTLAGCGSEASRQQSAAPPPPTVVVEPAELKDLVNHTDFSGRIEAIDKVQLRARVQGFLKKRGFVEGAEVKKGGLLFEIEPDSYAIAVNQAEANLASAEAAMKLAQQTFDRTSDLAKRNVSSQANLDTARSQLAQAQATVLAQQSNLQTAKLNLSYTKIEAPMDGRVGRTTYSVGNLVGPSSEPLVTIVAQDPMYVTFPVPQSILLAVRKAGLGPDSVSVELRLSDGSVYAQKGTIRFADVQATSSTDSVIVRASIPNPERLLVDQQLISVRVIRKDTESKLVIPQAALVLDQQGSYVLSVDSSNKVGIKRIVIGEQRGPMLIVNSGLSAGNRVIVSGHQKARPGAIVSPISSRDAARQSDGQRSASPEKSKKP
jgi:membrane fusion protein (multidrug efflux system)